MKTLSTILITLGLFWLIVGDARAQAIGEIISYQGKITNADGTPVSNGTYPVTIKIKENGIEKTSQTLSVATLGRVFSAFLSVGTLTFDVSKSYTLEVTANGTTSNQPIAAVPVAKTAASIVGPGATPIGGVMMWWSDGTLPDGWAVCDGATVSNSASPLNGKSLPDLRAKFVRGVGNSNLRATPVTGGADSINLSHNHTVNAHTHSISTDGNHAHEQNVEPNNGFGGGDRMTARGGTEGHTDTAAAGNHNHSGATGSASPGTNSQLSPTQSIIPAYVGLVYIIRIF